MKKISGILAMALALVTAVSCALAEMAEWKEIALMIAPLEHDGYYDTWSVKDKMDLVMLLENKQELYDIDEVGDLLGDENAGLSDEEKNELCDTIMSKFINGPVSAVTLKSILEVIHGKENTWSMADKKWYTDVLKQYDLQGNDDKYYVLPQENELIEQKATERALNFLASVGAEYLDQCQVDATLLEEQETTYNDGLLDTVKGRRIWVITFDPEKPDAVNGGKCEVKMLATGPVVQYTVPDLKIMYMTGTLPDADGISRSEILAIGKEELSTLLSTPEEDLLNLKVYFGFINSRDEVATHAGYGQRVWAVHYPPQAYVLMDPDGKVLYAGKYDLASIVK